VRRVLLAAVLLAVTPAAATSSADRPLLTYAVAPIQVIHADIPLGLCATDLHGSTFRLTGPHNDDHQSWSPDGRSLAFTGPADPAAQDDHPLDLFVTDAQGRHIHNLTRGGGQGTPSGTFGWSPDGSELGGNWRSGYGTSVFIAKADGTGLRLLAVSDSRGDPFGYSWSPDGTQILLTRFPGSNPGPTISVIDANGTNERQLVQDAYAPSWSPDGRQFAYVADIDGRGTGLAVAQADGSNAHLLLNGTDLIGKPMWSPDGSRLAFIESPNGGNGNLAVVRADGSDVRVLATDISGGLQWSPDGSLIASSRGTFHKPRVVVITLDGHEQYVAAGSDPVWRTAAALPANRRPCIVRGTSRADVIHGTSRGDVILAGRGKDRVYGGGGDDVIVGGLGQDRLFGGAGKDVFSTRDRLRDYVFGGSGSDNAYTDPVDVLKSVEHFGL
jgi:dipeptidyl aminopeptidase/acylaminoacyl peptidase